MSQITKEYFVAIKHWITLGHIFIFTWVLLLHLFEQDIPCEDLRSKLSALLTVQPHIEAQTEINAQLMTEVEKYFSLP